MSSTLEGKIALVTGASRGIGADTAKVLADQGAHVVCTARTLTEEDNAVLEGSLEGTVEAINDANGTALPIAANLATDDGCEDLATTVLDAVGHVDVLVNNAAVGFFAPIVDLKPSRLALSWRITVHAAFRLSQLLLPGMIERGAGRIINISSESAVGPGRGPYRDDSPVIGDTAYGAQKAMIERFTQGLAQEVQRHGVGVAAVAPSQIVPTPGALYNKLVTGVDDPRAEDPGFMPEAIRILATAPLEDVAGRVVYSQQLLLERGVISYGAGLGVDDSRQVSGFART